MAILKEPKKVFIVSGLIFLLTGILMCIWPVGTTGIMCILAGLVLLGSGVWKTYGYFKKKDYALSSRLDFVTAALQAMLGIVLIVKTQTISEIVGLILGVIVLVNSVFQIQIALELQQKKFKNWWYHLAAALGCGLIALVMMFDPFNNYRLMSVFMGIAFAVDGAADLWTAFYVKKQLSESAQAE